MGYGVRAERKLRDYARRMRREPTEPEIRLWRHLSNSQLGGFKFRRQAAIPPFIVDFFCPSKGLVVEVDGETHVPEADAKRDALLAEKGFTTIRFTNWDVRDNMDGVLITILNRLRERPDRWNGSTSEPHPNPWTGRRVPRTRLWFAGRTKPVHPEGEGLDS